MGWGCPADRAGPGRAAPRAGLRTAFEHAQRSALLSAGLSNLAGLPAAEARTAYYLTLLRTVGCTGDDDVAFRVLGEDMGEWTGPIGGASTLEAIALIVRNVGRDRSGPRRLTRVVGALAGVPAIVAASAGHCEVGQLLARTLGLGADVVRGLGQVFERWDGVGIPRRLKGDAIDRAVRVATLASDAETALRTYGHDHALELLRRRSNKGYDPRLVDLLCREGPALFAACQSAALTDAVLAAEPGPPERLSGARLEGAIRAMGEYADLKSRYTRGHSAGVAGLVAAAAGQHGLSPADCIAVVRAAHLHDIGRAGVFQRIWDKEGALTEAEWERVRMHTYFTERILARLGALGEVANVAALAHERLDGRGYHRRLPAAAITMSARLLAAADVYHAMTEARAHRPALPPAEAAAELRRESASGRFDRDAVAAVLAAAGQARLPVRASHPAGLSDREVQVLRILARGRTNKEIAVQLKISAKTAGNHVQHIFEKAGVTTRAAATLFAMQNDLLFPDP